MIQREKRISQLTDQQVLSITDSLSGEFATPETPEGTGEQVHLLHTLLTGEGHPIDLSKAADANTTVSAQAAREVLLLMAQLPEMQTSIDEWLDNPPVQEAAALPLILAAPVVLTACIVLLQVAGHVRIKKNAAGSWEFDYNPKQKTPLDGSMKDIVKTLAALMGKLK